MRFLAVALGLLLAAAGATAVVRAQVTTSPAITPARITVESPIAPGTLATLPSLAVRNEGDVEATYRMSVTPVESDDPAAPWVRLEPVEFTLTPGDAREVRVTVDVPAGAPHGDHSLRLAASVVRPPTEGGLSLSVSVAVASTLVFTVGDREASGPGLVRYWPALIAAMVAGAAAYGAAAAVDRLEFQPPVRRRRPAEDDREDDGTGSS